MNDGQLSLSRAQPKNDPQSKISIKQIKNHVILFTENAKKNFLLIHAKNKYKVRDIAQDIYYFLIIFLILALLLAGELSTLTRSFNNPTIIPIILFTLLRSNLGLSLTADFVRLIWYSLPLVEYIPSGEYQEYI